MTITKQSRSFEVLFQTASSDAANAKQQSKEAEARAKKARRFEAAVRLLLINYGESVALRMLAEAPKQECSFCTNPAPVVVAGKNSVQLCNICERAETVDAIVPNASVSSAL